MSANHRDMLHKRQHRHVARDPQKDKSQPIVSSPSSVDPETSVVATPSSSQASAPKTTDTPAHSSSQPTPSSAASSSPSSTSAPSSSSPTAASSASGSSSATDSASSVASTQSAASSIVASHASVSTKVVVPGASLTSLSATPTTTSHSGSSGGTSTAGIVGIIAGVLAGIAVLGFLLMWLMRRQRNKDMDDFDAQAFKRQSAMLVDDPVEPPLSHNPRPPTMIERHNASPALAAQAGYGGQNFYGSYGGYAQQSSYPPEMIQPGGSPPPQAYGAPPMAYAAYSDPPPIARQPSNVGYPPYDSQQQQQLARQPSHAAYLTRQPSAPPNPVEPGTRYVDLNRSSVSPYQAAQYADISRQLGTPDPNQQDALELPDDPLPSPFDDPVQPDAPSHAAAPPAPVNAAQPQHRPATVYHENDAYGGI